MERANPQVLSFDLSTFFPGYSKHSAYFHHQNHWNSSPLHGLVADDDGQVEVIAWCVAPEAAYGEAGRRAAKP